jgi:hypothetical protein
VTEYVGDGVGGEYTMFVSLNVTCLPGIKDNKGCVCGSSVCVCRDLVLNSAMEWMWYKSEVG